MNVPSQSVPASHIDKGAAPPRAGTSVLALQDVFRIYREQDIETVALRGADLTIMAGEFVAIIGRSGSGKSTLLGIAAGLTNPSAGKVFVGDRDITRMNEDERATLRRTQIGTVFQQHNLIPFLSIRENVEVAMLAPDVAARRQRSQELLTQVGLGARMTHRPSQLSGGEQQRAAIAVALANKPTLLLADEVTGELDSVTAAGIMDLLGDLNHTQGMTIVMVTHNPEVAAQANRIVQMQDGFLRPYTLDEISTAQRTHTAALPPKAAPGSRVVVQAEHLAKTYGNTVHALQDITFSVRAGETLAIMGPSGCGKSTLLNLLGGLDRATSGSVTIGEQSLATVSAEVLATIRRRQIGVIFQAHNLLPTLNAWENVAIPLLLDGMPEMERRTRAVTLLERVGLGTAIDKLPDQMSTGQRQRVAIARSLAHHPQVVLADEPTGNLDSDTAAAIATLLVDIAHEEEVALILVTHDPQIAAHCQQIMQLADGRQVTPLRSQQGATQ